MGKRVFCPWNVPKQRAAIEPIYRWYIARYEAAVREKPELLKDKDAAAKGDES